MIKSWLMHFGLMFAITIPFGEEAGTASNIMLEAAQIEYFYSSGGRLSDWNWFDTGGDLVGGQLGVISAYLLWKKFMSKDINDWVHVGNIAEWKEQIPKAILMAKPEIGTAFDKFANGKWVAILDNGELYFKEWRKWHKDSLEIGETPAKDTKTSEQER